MEKKKIILHIFYFRQFKYFCENFSKIVYKLFGILRKN